MLFDTHLHTQFSTDSNMTFSELRATAMEKNCGIIVTEHLDLKYPLTGKFIFPVHDYFADYGKYRNDRVLLGIEIGMRQDCIVDNRQVVSQNPFDFVIGSIHVINQQDLYYAPYYEGRSKQEAYQEYFQGMVDCVNTHDFIDTLGHIDYIARYAPYPDPAVYYHEFSVAIDTVLISLVKQDIAMEINTRRFSNKQVIEQLVPLYRRFHELGGRYVTLGSDAHRPDAVASQLKDAWDLALTCQLQPVYYQDRQRKIMTV